MGHSKGVCSIYLIGIILYGIWPKNHRFEVWGLDLGLSCAPDRVLLWNCKVDTRRFEVWALNLSPYVALPCLGGGFNMGHDSEMACSGYTRIPD